MESVEEVLETLKIAPSQDGRVRGGETRRGEEARMDLTEPEKRLVGLLTEAPLHLDLIFREEPGWRSMKFLASSWDLKSKAL